MTNVHSIPIVPTTQEPSRPIREPQFAPATREEQLEVDKNIPVTLYEQRFGVPYATELFGMKDNFMLKLDKGMTNMLKTVDKFVLDYIKEQDLKTDKDTYKSVIEKLSNILKLNPNLKNPTKLDRIYKIIIMTKAIK